MTLRTNVSRFVRHNRLTWRYGLNLKPLMAYRNCKEKPAGPAKDVADEMLRNGIAIRTVDDFPGLRDRFEELAATVRRDEESQRDAIESARPQGERDQTIGVKTFLYMLHGHEPILDPSSEYCRFSLDAAFLDSANAYFGMFTRLRYYNVWRTFAGNAAARESQLWHRDRDDIQIMKVFVHLDDVDDQAGPFTYAPKTHLLGSCQRDPEGTLEKSVKRSNDEQMAAVVPPSEWIVARGKRGTVVFADTRGYHKGGLARGRDRLLFTCMYVSAASQVRELFGGVRVASTNEWKPSQQFALGDLSRLSKVNTP